MDSPLQHHSRDPIKTLLFFATTWWIVNSLFNAAPATAGNAAAPFLKGSFAQGCVPFDSALAAYPTRPRVFFGLGTKPSFPITGNSVSDFALYQHHAITFAPVHGFTEGVYIFLDLALRGAKKGLVIDVGGNFAAVSIFSVKLGHRVVAVEGNPRTADTWRFNTLLNCAQHRATLVESLISDKDNERVVWRDHGVAGAASAGKIEGSAAPDASEVRIAQSLDTLLAPHVSERALVLKADIEGFEPFAFRGAAGLFHANPPYYVIWECQLGTLETFDILAAFGYSFFYVGSMMMDEVSLDVQQSWREWPNRPIIGSAWLVAVQKYHTRTIGGFDIVAVHPDQQAGCPAAVKCRYW